ncbi:MAG: hypothetical protein UU18_C0031G0010 [Parcubacteria group bacterium GW2011_GWB2_40_8]|nr:MAG: hypothetical protein UU18_C0031G0010 [Parcubacteria group bacterium GW2011_GWB2_40_8]HCT93900.1 hypothetical protein [Rikenellaceae bacterium]
MMKQLKKTFTIHFSIAVLLSLTLLFESGCKDQQCKDQQNGLMEDNSTHIDLDNLEEFPSFFDFFSKIEIIPLETNTHSLLSDMNFIKVIPNGDYFYILDKKQNLIQIFNSAGKYVETIIKKGRGPGEYSLLYDFGINNHDNTIELLCPSGALYRYDLYTKDFIESIKLNESIRSVHLFERLSDDYYVFFSIFNDKKLLYYSKQKNEIVKTDYTLPDYILLKSTLKFVSSPFFKFKDTIRFFEGHNGFIYTINPATLSLTPNFKWDFGKYNFKLSEIPDNENDFYYYRLGKNISFKYASSFAHFTESENFVISVFDFRGKMMTLAYDKNRGKSRVFHKTKEGVQIWPGYSDNQYHYVFFPPNQLRCFVNELILDYDQRVVLNSINPDDNYVILKYTYK